MSTTNLSTTEDLIQRLEQLGVEKLDDRTIAPGHPPDAVVGGHPAHLVEGANMVELGSFMGGIYSNGVFAEQYVADVGPTLVLGNAFHSVADASILPDSQPTQEVNIPSINSAPSPWENT